MLALLGAPPDHDLPERGHAIKLAGGPDRVGAHAANSDPIINLHYRSKNLVGNRVGAVARLSEDRAHPALQNKLPLLLIQTRVELVAAFEAHPVHQPPIEGVVQPVIDVVA